MSADLDVNYILDGNEATEQIAQVVFRNTAHYWGTVTPKTVLIAGNTLVGEKLFERIIHLPA